MIQVFFDNSYSGTDFELDDEKIEIVSRIADAQAFNKYKLQSFAYRFREEKISLCQVVII